MTIYSKAAIFHRRRLIWVSILYPQVRHHNFMDSPPNQGRSNVCLSRLRQGFENSKHFVIFKFWKNTIFSLFFSLFYRFFKGKMSSRKDLSQISYQFSQTSFIFRLEISYNSRNFVPMSMVLFPSGTSEPSFFRPWQLSQREIFPTEK